MGINCFLLITGYFMCKQNCTWYKFLKLILEVKFYKFLFYGIFIAVGYSAFNLKGFYKMFFSIFEQFPEGFVAGYICLFMLIPFINKVIEAFDKKQLSKLILTLLTISTFIPAVVHGSKFEYISWYPTVYLIGAYIRLYPSKWTENLSISVKMFLSTMTLAILSIVTISFASNFLNVELPIYYFLVDSNKIFAIACAITMFLVFKNMKIRPSRIINTMAKATFGVLLIHANSDTMRQWLWRDTLQNTNYFDSQYLWIHALASVLVIYIVCVAIDLVRIYLLERPLFRMLGHRWPVLKKSWEV